MTILEAHCYIPLVYINHPIVLIREVGYHMGVITNTCLNKMVTDWWKEIYECGWSTQRSFFLSIRAVNRRALDKMANKRN
jgi:hypothetical protein